MKSSAADSEHTPHPFSTLDYASNTNPQSVSSYSFKSTQVSSRDLQSSLSHHGVKTLPKQFTCVAKTLSKNTRVKRASKNTSYHQKLFPTGHNRLWTCQNRFKRSWDLLLLKKKTRSYQFPTTPTQLPNGFKPTKRNKPSETSFSLWSVGGRTQVEPGFFSNSC